MVNWWIGVRVARFCAFALLLGWSGCSVMTTEQAVPKQEHGGKDPRAAAKQSLEPTKSPPREGPTDKEPKNMLTLSVSNQSSSAPDVDIKVEIDGEVVVDGKFEIGMGHTFVEHKIPLSNGAHTLVATSKSGDAKHVEKFELADPLWATLTYWYHSEDADGGEPIERSFRFSLSTQPISVR